MSDLPSEQEREIALLEKAIRDLGRSSDHLRRSIRAMSSEIEAYRSPRNALRPRDGWTVPAFCCGVIVGAAFWFMIKVFP